MTDSPRLPTWQRLAWASLAAIAFSAAAAAFAVPFFGVADAWPDVLSSSDPSFGVAAVLAAALVGWLCWFGVEWFGAHRPIVSGAVAGFVTGVVAHPVAWFLWPLLPPSELSVFAVLFPIYSIFSLLFLGWLTAALGIVAGVAVGGVRVGVLRLASAQEESRQ